MNLFTEVSSKWVYAVRRQLHFKQTHMVREQHCFMAKRSMDNLHEISKESIRLWRGDIR